MFSILLSLTRLDNHYGRRIRTRCRCRSRLPHNYWYESNSIVDYKDIGSYVSSRSSEKLDFLSPNICVCRSGSAADTQAISELVRYYLEMHTTELGVPPMVKTASSLIQKLIYNNKDNLTASMICAGWDKPNGGQVYIIPLGGVRFRQPVAIGGSGSTYIYSYVDANFKEKMTKEEAVRFVRHCISLAIARDGSSGGGIRTAVITASGVEREMIPGDRLPRFFPDL
eukprot:TRINITY_DN55_c0_g1_i7.p1 TRINITY_DN55_c0_g1~~TRINITY_DN55_c0_g1_i7.p1  ORF type:complete len:226 (-),score=15.70 TRINITY_DN55_c0_g1_i7:145-822(-)